MRAALLTGWLLVSSCAQAAGFFENCADFFKGFGPKSAIVGPEAKVVGHDFRSVNVQRDGLKVGYLRTNRGIEALKGYYPEDMLTDLAGKRVLDAGTGGGQFVTDLRRQGIDARGLDIHLSDAQRAQPHFVEADMRRMPFGSGEFDVIFSTISVLHYEGTNRPLVHEILREFARVLKSGGKVRVSPNHATLREVVAEMPELRILREGESYLEIGKR